MKSQTLNLNQLNQKALKIAIVFFIGLVIFNSIILLGIYRHGVKYYHDITIESMVNEISIVSDSLDIKLHEYIVSHDISKTDDHYEKFIAPLNALHKRLKNVKYIYTTYKEKNGDIFFGSNTVTKLENNYEGLISKNFFKGRYQDYPEYLEMAWSKKTMQVSSSSYCDKWGCFLGVFKPFFNSNNKIIGVLVLEVEESSYLVVLQKYRKMLVTLYFVLIVISFGLAFWMYKTQDTLIGNYQHEIETKKELEIKENMLIQESKLAEIGKLMAGITHEINNNIAVIQMASNMGKMMIQRKTPNNTFDTHEKNYEKISEVTQKMTDTIHSMKSIVRNSEDDQSQPVNVKEMITEIFKLLRIKAKNIDCDIRITNLDNSTVCCKRTQIEQVLLNLISNSFDAISTHNGPKWVEIKYMDDKDYDYIHVIDSGLGISLPLRKKIEKGFYTTKGNGQGSGMGLMISKTILEKHQGSLDYIEDVHTHFRLKIPKNQKA